MTQGDTGFGKTWTASGGTAGLRLRAEGGKPTLVMPVGALIPPMPVAPCAGLMPHMA